MRKYGLECKRILKRQINMGADPLSSLGYLGINLDLAQTLREVKEDINHEEEMDNFLNVYKLDNQELKLLKGAKGRLYPFR